PGRPAEPLAPTAPSDGFVFISYARENKAAGLVLAAELRRNNIPYWFDEEKLGGGDLYDAKIQRNIRNCFAFVPLISNETESRVTGYVFREWKWAVECSTKMPPNRTFFFPLLLDDLAIGELKQMPEEMREGIHI